MASIIFHSVILRVIGEVPASPNVSLKDQDNKELVVDGNFTGFVFTGGSQA